MSEPVEPPIEYELLHDATLAEIGVTETQINPTSDGGLLLDTVNRGVAATRWIAKLQGKKVLRAIIAADPTLGDSGP